MKPINFQMENTHFTYISEDNVVEGRRFIFGTLYKLSSEVDKRSLTEVFERAMILRDIDDSSFKIYAGIQSKEEDHYGLANS